mmetsp:Transcript_5835/g.16625  ORF Transcript_5835/g.16625 Transcript_5835/m.16625 type:complete len:160 (-) Transcript_5835:52-531(-)
MKFDMDLSVDTSPPPLLKVIAKFSEWDQTFCLDLPKCFNQHSFLLVYVIRPEDQTKVTLQEQTRSVGDEHGFSNWTDYNICCAALNGHHYTKDNQAVWTLLCAVVRSKPGWEYVQVFNTGPTRPRAMPGPHTTKYMNTPSRRRTLIRLLRRSDATVKMY